MAEVVLEGGIESKGCGVVQAIGELGGANVGCLQHGFGVFEAGVTDEGTNGNVKSLAEDGREARGAEVDAAGKSFDGEIRFGVLLDVVAHVIHLHLGVGEGLVEQWLPHTNEDGTLARIGIFGQPPYQKTNYPNAVWNTFGSGQVCYVAGRLGSTQFLEHQRVMVGMARKLFAAEGVILCRCPVVMTGWVGLAALDSRLSMRGEFANRPR